MKKYDEFSNNIEFRKYIRECGFKSEGEYFLKVYNKKDPYSLEPIPYKDKKQYLSQDFITRSNINKWIEKDPESGSIYLSAAMDERIKEKALIYAPSALELRSLKNFPTLPSIFKSRINWDAIASERGLIQKFIYSSFSIREPRTDIEVFVDTREQKPLSFEKSTSLKLAYGDYAPKNGSGRLFVERKSIQDLWGTMSKGFDRFKLEIERAKKDSAYLFVVVEYPIYKATSYNHNRRFSKASPEFVFSRIRELMQSYDNIQFVFSGDREKSKKLIEFIFGNEKEIIKRDIQYFLDVKEVKL